MAKHILFLSTLLIFSCGVCGAQQKQFQNNKENVEHTPEKEEFSKTIARLPLIFRKNQGQWNDDVLYMGNSYSSNVSFMKNRLSFCSAREKEEEHEEEHEDEHYEESEEYEYMVWNLHFVGVNINAHIEATGEENSRTNYITGNDPARWAVDVPDYRLIRYKNIYENIDLHYYGESGYQLKYDYIIKPGGKVEDIIMELEGIQNLKINEKGELEITTPWGVLLEKAPFSYQNTKNGICKIDVRYRIINNKAFGFSVNEQYDKSRNLIVDPVTMVWCTYAGATGNNSSNYSHDITVDNSRNVYITGKCDNTYPTTAGVYDASQNGNLDIFVTKFNPNASAMIYSTYIGGSGNDEGNAIKVNATGEVYVTGKTQSTNFPVAGAYQSSNGGGVDCFLAKLSSTGTALLFSTYLGGSAEDNGKDLVLDGSGQIFITGSTSSSNFPVTGGAFQTTNAAGFGLSAFVTRLNATASGLIYSTYLGGSFLFGMGNIGRAIAVNSAGEAYIAGSTASSSFPVTVGAFQTVSGGSDDGFITKLNSTGTGLIYSTYLGGSEMDIATGLALNSAGNVYVTGSTGSSNFPVTPGAYQTTGSSNAFISKLNTTGSSLVYSTYIGGSASEGAEDIAVNSNGEAYIIGSSGSIEVTTGAFDITANGLKDFFISKISADGDSLMCSSYIGGNSNDYIVPHLYLDASGSVDTVYANGTSHSTNFPTTAGVYQPTKINGGSGSDQPVVFKMVACANEPVTLTASTSAANVSCNGGSNGSATATPNGGTSPFTYSWSTVPVQSSQTATGLAAGAYTVTVTDASSNTTTSSVTITQPSALAATVSSQTNVSCNAGSNGAINLTPSGGTSPYTFLWSNGATTEDISNISAGTYTVTVTDANSCTKTTSATITQPASPLSTSISGTNVNCNGGSNGAANLTPSGGTSPYTFSWSNGASTEDLNGLAAGTYTITVTDNKSCTKTASVTISQPASPLAASIAGNNVSCNGGTNGAANLTPSGGTSPYAFLWSNGATTEDLSSLASGTYTVTITDNKSCTKTASVTISQPGTALSASVTGTNVSCNGGNNGAANLTPSGGISPYTYSWSNGITTQDLSGITSGTYTVTVTDNNSCTKTASVTVSQPSSPLSASIAGTNVNCNGGNNGSANLTPSGGTSPYTYLWSNGATTEDLSNITAGTYTITVTDNNSCTKTASVTISQPTALTVSISVTNASCGNANGEATANPSGGNSGYTYLWSSGQTTQTATGLNSGTNGVTVTDASSCTQTASVLISNPVPAVSITDSVMVTCNGLSNGSAVVTPSGGATPYTYNWSNGQADSTVTGLSAGVFIVTVQDDNGCSAILDVEVTEPASISISNTVTAVSCNGGNNGAINIAVSGGTTSYSYLWSTSATNEDISGLVSGTYTVTITDGNSCSASAGIPVTEPAVLNASVSGINVSCIGGNNGSADLTPSGGASPYTFLWSDGAVTEDLNNVSAGSYTVTVTDNNSCIKTGSVTITQPSSAVSASISGTNVNCNGGNNGAANLSPSGGTSPYTFLWSNSATTEDINSLTSGTYTVTVTDNNSCTATSSVVISQPSGAVSASASGTNVSCNGGNNGAANLTPSGGTSPYTFLWSNSATTEDINSVTAGTYSVTVTDNNSCTVTSSVTISQPANAVSASISATDVSCFGGNNGAANLSASGGTPPFSYSWSNASSSEDISNLSAGIYTVTITDNNGCTKTENVTINQPSNALSASIAVTNVSCNGGNNGAVNLTVSGGTSPYSFLWSNGASTEDLTGVMSGNYSVSVTDNNLCSFASTAVVSQPVQLTVATSVTDAACGNADGNACISTVSGGTTPYSYNWSNGSDTSCTGPVASGSYSSTVTDGSGCTTTATLSVSDLGGPSVSIASSTNVTCNGGANGTASISITGGTTPYTFLWTNGETTANATALNAGAHSVTITDDNSCKTTVNLTISEPALLNASIAGTDVSCNSGNNGSAGLTPSGGTSPYTFLWSDGSVSEDLNSITAGTYTVTVTDNNSCASTASVSISQPASAVSASVAVTHVNCNGENNGAANLTTSGGTSPYSYAWSNSAGTEDISGVSAGTYSVTVTDSNNCTINTSVTINQPPDLTVSAAVNNASCGNANGEATANPSGGVTGYTYLWSDGQTSQTATGLSAGVYYVTVTDANGCTEISSALVSNPVPAVNFTDSAMVSCNGLVNGSAVVTPSGGTPPYSYNWSNGQTDSAATGLNAGIFLVTVQDNIGCVAFLDIEITEPAALSIADLTTNISCNGGNNGAINITVSGGTSPYSYLWSNASASEDISGLVAGTYTITTTDNNSCALTVNYTITEPSLLSASANATNVGCNGGSDGSAMVSVNGGTSPYTYLWNTGAVTQNISSLSAGTYSVTATDNNSCTVTAIVTVSEPPSAVSSSAVATNVSCFGGNNGSATLTVNGGVSPYSFLWNNGTATQNLVSLQAGAYSVTITDNNSCTSTATVTISEPASPISTSISAADVSCNGGTNGAADLNASGGTSPYSFSWSNSVTTEDLSAIPAGTYSVTITDGNNCIANTSITINQPPDLSVSAVVNNASCGNNNGEATANPAGGASGYTYLWSNGDTAQTVTGLNAGVYGVTVTDANGCTETASALVSNPVPAVNITDSLMVSCNGLNDGSAVVTPSGGTPPYTYNWSNGQTDSAATGLNAGTFIVTVQDNIGCVAFLDIDITEPPALLLADVVTNVSCNGGSDGAINITVSGGSSPYSYLWSNASASEDISGLVAGTYTITTTDNNSCALTVNYTITESSLLSASANATNVGCNGGSDGSAMVSVNGGTSPYTYLWNTGAVTQNISSLPAGTYSVTTTDNNSCNITANVTISQPAPMSISTTSDFSTCGNADGQSSASVSGGTFPYSYLWSDGQTGTTATGLTAGNFIVTITDFNGCSDTAITSVFNIGGPFATTSVTNTQCFSGNDGQATVFASGDGPFNYSWSDGQTGITATGLSSGTYYVTVTDTVGCTYNALAIVGQPGTITASAAATICSGDSVFLQGIFQTSAGTYYDTLSASNGCDSIIITNLIVKSVTVNSTTAFICSEDSAYLQGAYQNVSGNYYDTLIASNGCDSIVITALVVFPPIYTNNSAEICLGDSILLQGSYQDTSGIYYDILSSANGCDSIIATALTVNLLPSLAVSITDVLCNGDSTGEAVATVSGGTTPYTFLWSNGQVSSLDTGLAVGNYSVTITDAKNCFDTATLTVNQPMSVSVSATSTQDACGASIGSGIATGSGGTSPFSYSWNNGQATSTATGLTAGNYSVTVTDSSGCMLATEVTVTDTGSVTASISSSATSVCSGDTITLTASGGTNYTWNTNDSASTITFSLASSSVFIVTVTEGVTCSDIDSVFISVVPLPTATISGDSVLCAGESTTLTASGNGSYLWNNGATSATVITNTSADLIYSVTVTNACGSDVYSIPVKINSTPTANAGNDTTVVQETEVTLIASGGTSYIWNTNPPETNQVIFVTPEETTTYFVTVTNANGCSAVDSVEINVDFQYVIFVPSMFSPNGNGKNDAVYVRGIGIKSIYFVIYDRWGEKVFETTDITFGWNGKYKGKDMNSAVFVYVLKATMADESIVEKKGNITLVR